MLFAIEFKHVDLTFQVDFKLCKGRAHVLQSSLSTILALRV